MTDTMLDALRFYSDVSPGIQHRGQYEEWTGFPLMDQPGVRDRLHPEEPSDEQAARSWLDGRRPNGDVRIICGELTRNETEYLVGLTFVGRLSYSPFVETVDQVRSDLAAGFPYVVGDTSTNTAVREETSHAVQGQVIESRSDVTKWTNPVRDVGTHEYWARGRTADAWCSLVEMEQVEGPFASSSYLIRRARRLNALVTYQP